MPLIHSFCTWFSIRMGSAIVAVLSLFQGAISIGISIFFQWYEKNTTDEEIILNDENIDLSFTKPVVEYLRKNIRSVLRIIEGFLLIYICGCLSLLHGCFQPKTWKILPFVVMDFIRLFVLMSLYAASMVVVQKNVLDFNILIACLMCGGFTLLLLCYFWLCPMSFLQIIRVINKREKPNQKLTMPVNQTFFYEYLQDFQPERKFLKKSVQNYFQEYSVK